jgi:hypothetical protein
MNECLQLERWNGKCYANEIMNLSNQNIIADCRDLKEWDIDDSLENVMDRTTSSTSCRQKAQPQTRALCTKKYTSGFNISP